MAEWVAEWLQLRYSATKTIVVGGHTKCTLLVFGARELAARAPMTRLPFRPRQPASIHAERDFGWRLRRRFNIQLSKITSGNKAPLALGRGRVTNHLRLIQNCIGVDGSQ